MAGFCEGPPDRGAAEARLAPTRRAAAARTEAAYAADGRISEADRLFLAEWTNGCSPGLSGYFRVRQIRQLAQRADAQDLSAA